MSSEYQKQPSLTAKRLKEILIELAEVNLQCEDSRDLISIEGIEKVKSKLAS